MLSIIGNRKIIVSILTIVSLIVGVQGLSDVQAAPDLRVGDPSLSPSTVNPGGTFTISVIVTNGGTTASAATTLGYYRSDDSTINTDDELVETQSVSPLASDANSGSITSPSLTAPTIADTYYYGAYVLPVPNETNRGNNGSIAATLTVQSTARPNLTVALSSPTYLYNTVAPGRNFILYATVTNRGDGTSSATTLRSEYRSSTSNWTSTGSNITIAALRPNQQGRQYPINLTAPNIAGIYSYRVYVHPITNESNTDDNYSNLVRIITSAADLVVDTPTVDKSTLAPGESFTLTATVRNQGIGNSGAATLRYYRSTDATISNDSTSASVDTEVGTADSIDILSGSNIVSSTYSNTSTQTVELTAPSEPGTYYYGACVSATLYESRRDNNCSSAVTITVTTPPDLVAELFELRGTSTLAPGERFTLDATVTNEGVGQSATTTLRFYESVNRRFRSEDEVGRVSVSALASNISSNESIRLVAPSEPGTYYYRVHVDEVANEEVTSNNWSGYIVVFVETPLVIESLQPSKFALSPGERFTLTATIKNDGDTASTRTTVQYYRSDDDSITSRDTSIGTDTVSAIAAGRTSQVSRSLTAPNAGGTYYYGVCVGDDISSDACSVIKITVVAVLIAESQRPPMYWIDAQAGTLQTLTGSRVDRFVQSVQNATGVAVDAGRGKVYWAEDLGNKTGRIRRANLDGTNVQLIRKVAGVPRGIAIDASGGKLYVTHSWGKMQRLNLKGENHQSNFIPKLDSPKGIAVDAAGGKIYWTVRGKIQRANINGRNVEDVVTGLATPVGIALNAPAARTEAASAPAAAAMAPNATALHANYPNPFNPETWIPYQLQKPTEVQISIYNQSGILIRELALGYQAAGQYISRSRAAYWDGRNQVGEPVASGLYFYTLAAGDFSATRKMLILK